jgi:4-carboxymuconolactone decarboxylase
VKNGTWLGIYLVTAIDAPSIRFTFTRITKTQGTNMANTQERQDYLDKMHAQRGFVADFHKFMVLADFAYLSKANELAEVAYTSQRLLDRKTKELVFIAISTMHGTDRDHLKLHVQAALKAGATGQEILEVLEMLGLAAGQMALRFGLDVWAEVINPPRLEPSKTKTGRRK